MKKTTFTSTEFELVTKRTRQREFLDEINFVVSWTELTGLIQPLRLQLKRAVRLFTLPQYFASI